MQLYWLTQYYHITKKDFEREVNLSFEDALKREFSIRCDSVELFITENLLDSNEYIIKSRFNATTGRYEYIIANAKTKLNKLSFTTFEFNERFIPGDTALKRKIAKEYSKRIRTEDLENHLVFYRLQNLGVFTTSKVQELAFDTFRLRQIGRASCRERV